MKSIAPCKPEAEKWTGYQVGGMSPFGMRKKPGLRRAHDPREERI
jgi:prolyl-tRNA editing enzyme YbaK/EbsC (Cys-tRNA(Pro) deacylase)